MSAAVISSITNHPSPQAPTPTAPDAPRETSSTIPTISFTDTSRDEALRQLSTAAKTHGLATITSLPSTPSFSSIQSLFDRLSSDVSLAARVNATYPIRGIFKHAALDNPHCDQKFTIDLSRNRLSGIPAALQNELGAEFLQTVKFFNQLHEELVPLLLDATNAIIGGGADLRVMHKEENVNYRMCDYRPLSEFPGEQLQERRQAHRCGEHRDYGTLTVLFQNGESGLEYVDPAGNWTLLPGDAALVLWGLCGEILSGGQIKAVRHRVRRTAEHVRRNSVVMFVAPDMDAVLKPLNGDAKEWSRIIREGDLTVDGFKEVIGKTWRKREGNAPLEEGDEAGHAGYGQSEAVERLIKA